MTDGFLSRALAHWGLADRSPQLIAARENHVYRVDTAAGPCALRLHRAGLRSTAELSSELDWMAALAAGGMTVPAPIPAPDGTVIFRDPGDSGYADLLVWLDGDPMGRDGSLLPMTDPEGRYRILGAEMAAFHDLSDRWDLPAGFTRHAWDAEGLVGETPLWGRFWENPLLDAEDVELFVAARQSLRSAFEGIGADEDYGLIHADLVPENVLFQADRPCLIDFDDGGFGYRLFDLATTFNRAERADTSGRYGAAFLEGYQSRRRIDLGRLPLFHASRSFTYVGWSIPRLEEPGARDRALRHIGAARVHAGRLLGI